MQSYIVKVGIRSTDTYFNLSYCKLKLWYLGLGIQDVPRLQPGLLMLVYI